MRIWRSEVHDIFRESLYYYLLTVRRYHKEIFMRNFLDFLKSMGFNGCCCYELFGAFDILIRIWLPVGMENDFKEKLQSSIPTIGQIQVFKEERIRKYWCLEKFKPFDRKSIERVNHKDIQSIQEGTAPSELLKLYYDAGLFTEIDKSKNIKFFIGVRPTQSMEQTAEDKTMDFLETALDEFIASNHILKPSLYKGYGFAWVLIKAEVEPINFFHIADFVFHISEGLSDFGIFTTTYICCREDSYETDDISIYSLNRSIGWDLAVAAIVPEIYDLVVPFSQEYTMLRYKITDWIHQCLDQYILDNEEHKIIHGCLYAIVKHDEDVFCNTLYEMFRKLEKFLRERMPIFVASRISDKEVGEAYRTAGVSRDDSKHPALGDILKIYVTTVKMKPKNQTGQEELLGPWEDFIGLRNLTMHGSIDPLRKWKDYLTLLVSYFGKLKRLKNTIENETRDLIKKDR